MKWTFEGEGINELRKLRDDLNELFGEPQADGKVKVKESKDLTMDKLMDEYLNFPDERRTEEAEDVTNG